MTGVTMAAVCLLSCFWDGVHKRILAANLVYELNIFSSCRTIAMNVLCCLFVCLFVCLFTGCSHMNPPDRSTITDKSSNVLCCLFVCLFVCYLFCLFTGCSQLKQPGPVHHHKRPEMSSNYLFNFLI